MIILISGASGLIGTQLSAHLERMGHEVIRLVRRRAGANEVSWDPAKGLLNSTDIEGIDAVIHLSGASIGDKRWT
ncbi:MAG: NAD-dependent epimerase/dehydratase family protein, partial [Actinomycetota bacterium]